MSNTIYLLIGGNLGDREHYLQQSRLAIEEQAGRITGLSSIYETQSWGYCDNDYLNQVICLQSSLEPEELLERTSAIEQQLGRIRNKEGYQARTVDIDILFYNSCIVNTSRLTIPHPRIQERRFVLTPLCDIAPDMEHPVLLKTIKELLQDCKDNCNVKKYLKK